MDEGLAGELERAGRMHALLRMLRDAERSSPPPRAALPALPARPDDD